jgi:transposase
MMIDWSTVAKRLGYESELHMWTDLYLGKHFSINILADRFGSSHSAVRDALRRVKIPLRPRGGANRKRDPRWPPDDDLLALVDEHGAVKVSEQLEFSYSAVYKRARKLRKENDAAKKSST